MHSNFASSGESRQIEYNRNVERQRQIKEYVNQHGLIELKSDYFGMNSYYLHPQQRIIYKVCNICDWSGSIIPNFAIDNDPHIRQLNNL